MMGSLFSGLRPCHWCVRSVGRASPTATVKRLSVPVRALRHRVADSPDRKTARLLPTLGDEEPISIGLPGDKLRSVAGRNIRGGFSLWLRLATVCVLVACGTICGMRSTVLIFDDHAAFRASARA